MNKDQAKKIGKTQALKSVCWGLLIAQLMMTWLSSDQGLINAFFWFLDFNYQLNVIVGVTIMLLCGYYYGQLAGVEILIKKKNHFWIGFKYGMATFLTTIFLASWTAFFQEGLKNMGTEDNPFSDYILKPFFWVLVFGLIPVLLVGFWFGTQIKKHEINP